MREDGPEMVTEFSIQCLLTMESSVPTTSASTIVIVKLPSSETEELAAVTVTVGWGAVSSHSNRSQSATSETLGLLTIMSQSLAR
jgi:hypothetical protein